MVSAAIRANTIAPLSIHPGRSRRPGGDVTGRSCSDRRRVAGSGGAESHVGSASSSTPRATDDKGSNGDEDPDASGTARLLSPPETGVHCSLIEASGERSPARPSL